MCPKAKGWSGLIWSECFYEAGSLCLILLVLVWPFASYVCGIFIHGQWLRWSLGLCCWYNACIDFIEVVVVYCSLYAAIWFMLGSFCSVVVLLLFCWLCSRFQLVLHWFFGSVGGFFCYWLLFLDALCVLQLWELIIGTVHGSAALLSSFAGFVGLVQLDFSWFQMFSSWFFSFTSAGFCPALGL